MKIDTNIHSIKHSTRCAKVITMVAVTAFTLILSLAGCSSARAVEHWNLFNNVPSVAAAGQNAKVVVYRKFIDNDPTTIDRNPINIYINGHYAHSLLPMSSGEVLVCPGLHGLSARKNLPESVLGDKVANSTQTQLPRGGVRYFLVQQASDATPKLLPVTPEQAAKDMAGMRQQAHTLPRVNPFACV